MWAYKRNSVLFFLHFFVCSQQMWQYRAAACGKTSEHAYVCIIMREIITLGCKQRRDENNNALPTAQLTV